MASARGHHRRGSMEEPLNLSSDVNHLKEELNRLHKDIFPEYNKNLETISDLINELDNSYRLETYALRGAVITGGIVMLFVVLASFLIDEEVFDIVAGSGAVVAVVAVLCVALGRYRKTQQEKLKLTIEKELKEFQDNINPIVDIMEEICQRTEEILRGADISEHKAQELSEHFAYCFEKRQLFQEQDRTKVDNRMSKIVHFSGKLSEMIAKVSSVPDILKEIIEDNKRQRDKPAKPTHEQIHNREFKEKAEKFITDMQRGICELKNTVKRINQTADKMSDRLSSA